MTPPDSGEREVTCDCGLTYHPPPRPVTIPLPLAQRILAALEDRAGRDLEMRAIVAELRAHLPQEPK